MSSEMCRVLNKHGRESWAEAWGQALTKLMDLAVERVKQRTVYQEISTQRKETER